MLRERKSNRLKDFDYSSDRFYFVTSCVKDRICCFGNIERSEMHVNKFGEIASTQWTWLAKQYEYVRLHAFIVMPNHIHGIIEIKRDAFSYASVVVGAGRDLPLQQPTTNNISDSDTIIKIKSLSELMGAFKTTSSKQIRLAGLTNFAWQRSFYDHIIRNQIAYQNISNYINENPLNWKYDNLYEK